MEEQVEVPYSDVQLPQDIVQDVPGQFPEWKNGVVELNSDEQKVMALRIQQYEGKDYLLQQKECYEFRDYYFSKQWTETEINENDDRGQYSIVLNKTRKALNAMAGMFSSNKPRFSVVPMGGEDTSMTTLTNQLLDYIFYKSNGLTVLRQICLYGLRDNIGYLCVTLDENNDVVFKALDFTDVVVDPKSRDPLFKDADWIYVKRWVPTETIKELYGVDVRQFPCGTRPKEWDRHYNSSLSLQDGSAKIGQLVSDDNNYALVYEGRHKRYVKQTDGTFRREIVRQTILGYNYVFNEVMPRAITDYDIIPFYTEHTGNPYCKGEMFFIRDFQDLLNKALGITILNAQINGNGKTYVYEKSIKGDVEEWKSNWSDVNSLNILSGDGSDGNTPPPVSTQGQPLPAAWFQLIQFIMAEMQAASLPNDITGYKDSSDRSQEMLFEKREAVMDSLKLALGNFEGMMSLAGKVMIQFSKGYMNKKKIFRIVDAQGSVTAFLNNIKVGLNTDDPATLQRYREQLKKAGRTEIEIEDVVSKAKADTDVAKALKMMNSEIDDIDVDMIVVPGSYGPSWEASQWGAYMRMRQVGVQIDDEDIILVSPIQNRNVVAVKASQNKKLISQNRALFQENDFLKDKVSELEQLMLQNQMNGQLKENQFLLDKRVADQNNKNYVMKKLGQSAIRSEVSKAKQVIQLKTQETLQELEAASKSMKETGNETSLMNVLLDIDKYTDKETFDLYNQPQQEVVQ